MRTKVYDLVNAGPRHRFLSNGYVLANCGKIFQPQNLSRATLKHKDIIAGIDALKDGAASLLDYDIMKLTSSALRYAICAAKGKKLVVADLSNIEGRVLSYLAGEDWKLRAFEEFDTLLGVDGEWYAGSQVVKSRLEGRPISLRLNEKGKTVHKGHDLYRLAYSRSFDIPAEGVDDDQRQVGKVQELALGYAGGAGAIVTFALTYGVDLRELADKVLSSTPESVITEAEGLHDWLIKQDESATRGLDKEVYVALDCLKRLWRLAHPKTVQFWEDAETALRNAVAMANTKFEFGNGLYAMRKGKWTGVWLPSGHVIPYPGLTIDGRNLAYKGVHQFSKQWTTLYTHGGKIVENCVQAYSRDVFKFGALAAEKAGYPIILPVHDELVTEVPDTDEYSVHELEAIMATIPPWAKGLPLAAEGFSDYRYHK